MSEDSFRPAAWISVANAVLGILHYGMFGLPRIAHGLRQVVRAPGVGVDPLDLEYGVQILKGGGGLQLAHDQHLLVGLRHELSPLETRLVDQSAVVVEGPPASAPASLAFRRETAGVNQGLRLLGRIDVRPQDSQHTSIQK